MPAKTKKKKIRKAFIDRKTAEVEIKGEFVIDGTGKTLLKTGCEPLNHLLTLFAFHGLFDLRLEAKGDLEHHLIEDVGIALGKAFKQALADKIGINRYGSFSVTMDKVVVEANVDISGRPSVHKEILASDAMRVQNTLTTTTFDDTTFTFRYAEEFLEAFANHAGISLVYYIKSGEGDLHHLLEAFFKALGKALDQATQLDPRRKGIPSTKGIID